MTRTLDQKLADLHARPGESDAFILADAKDADMAFGLAAPGIDHVTGHRRSLAEFREQIREIVHQGLVDIMLMSLSTSEQLAAEERLFDASPVTPAIRANDTSDIHFLAGAAYPHQPSRPFCTAIVPQIVRAGADLALYSITPMGDADVDIPALSAYREFRAEAEASGLRHFLEVFAPNVPKRAAADPGRFLNDFVARTLAAVPRASRPLFLKMPYFGAEVMRELVAYDPNLIPGILGGASGTTYDAFFLLEDARRNGARVALFGRKIKNSEHPLTFVSHLRAIADGRLDAREAYRSYHAELERLGITPRRPLEQDLELTTAL
ncbi:MAG: hypothetical protein ACXVH1_29945 [Solirubrobacteraceae bacterium]